MRTSTTSDPAYSIRSRFRCKIRQISTSGFLCAQSPRMDCCCRDNSRACNCRDPNRSRVERTYGRFGTCLCYSGWNDGRPCPQSYSRHQCFKVENVRKKRGKGTFMIGVDPHLEARIIGTVNAHLKLTPFRSSRIAPRLQGDGEGVGGFRGRRRSFRPMSHSLTNSERTVSTRKMENLLVMQLRVGSKVIVSS